MRFFSVLFFIIIYSQFSFSSQNISNTDDFGTSSHYKAVDFPFKLGEEFKLNDDDGVFLKVSTCEQRNMNIDLDKEEHVISMYFFIIRSKDNKYIGYLKSHQTQRAKLNNSVFLELIEHYSGFQNPGYDRQAMSTFMNLVERRLDFNNYIIRLRIDNSASINFYEGLGFKESGVHSKECTALFMEKPKGS